MNRIFFICFTFISCHSFAQKIFHQPDAKGTWQYIYPFTDKSYVMAIQYLFIDGKPLKELPNTNIYFGKSGKKADVIFWRENLDIRQIKNNITYEDYNNDGIKDLLIFEDTGARGGNSFYNLYLVNPKNYTLTRVKGFDKIVNPSYNKKHQVIVSYALSGTNNYQLYKLDKNHKLSEIGDSFEDTEQLDLDQRITAILKKYDKLKQQK